MWNILGTIFLCLLLALAFPGCSSDGKDAVPKDDGTSLEGQARTAQEAVTMLVKAYNDKNVEALAKLVLPPRGNLILAEVKHARAMDQILEVVDKNFSPGTFVKVVRKADLPNNSDNINDQGKFHHAVFEITEVKEEGSEATAILKVTIGSGSASRHMKLVKRKGTWKISDPGYNPLAPLNKCSPEDQKKLIHAQVQMLASPTKALLALVKEVKSGKIQNEVQLADALKEVQKRAEQSAVKMKQIYRDIALQKAGPNK